MVKKRNRQVDIVSGFFIIYMIFTHICQLSYNVGWPVYKYSLLFLYAYMFFFFFRSGFYFYPIAEQSSCLRKNVKSLFWPYIKYSLISYIIYLFVEGNIADWDLTFAIKQPIEQILTQGAFAGNFPLWFLLTLFLVKVTFNYMHRLADSRIWLIATLIITLVLQFLSNHRGISIPYTIGSTFVAIAIYSIGVIVKEHKIDIYNSRILWTSIVLYVISLLIDINGVDIRSNSCEGSCLPWFIMSFASCVVALNFARALITPPPVYLTQLVKYLNKFTVIQENIGKNSMQYFVWHWIVLLVVRRVYYALNFTDNRYLLVCMVIACILILPLIVKAESYFKKTC